jgi:hypothetical protein
MAEREKKQLIHHKDAEARRKVLSGILRVKSGTQRPQRATEDTEKNDCR